jgi:hypothetical protein
MILKWNPDYDRQSQLTAEKRHHEQNGLCRIPLISLMVWWTTGRRSTRGIQKSRRRCFEKQNRIRWKDISKIYSNTQQRMVERSNADIKTEKHSQTLSDVRCILASVVRRGRIAGHNGERRISVAAVGLRARRGRFALNCAARVTNTQTI